jgi:glutamine amidotransferase
MTGTIAIVDYGAGNLRSLANAVGRLCRERGNAFRVEVTSDPDVLDGAEAVMLPGVGAARATMQRLTGLSLDGAIRRAARSKPFLGVCLGMQLLYEFHEEGEVQGLGVLPGSVRRFADGLKTPHTGWNRLFSRPHPMVQGIRPDAYFYYVHSYYVCPQESRGVVGESLYGRRFPGAVADGNLWATQFHPEKSGDDGLRLLANFIAMVEGV